ncbi:MAG: hypothetical protein JKY56_21430 [Kofleriaceae bacterium]|nr:hypothetical protein [Kofleriaceae bacterium]
MTTGMGDVDLYKASGMKLNVMANFLFRPDIQVGAQGYLGFTNLPADEPSFNSALTIIDVGVAIYKHIPVTDQIELTALAGIHITGQKAEPSSDELFLGFGARASVSADYAFGPGKEHVVSFAPALTIYGGVADTELIASDFGLDEPSAALEFGFSYQYRFTSAFGQSGIFSLE